MEHYKSWSYLRNYLLDCLCASLKGRVDYFFTRYHKMHDSYGRASILIDGRDAVCFDWANEREQALQISEETSRSGIHWREAEKSLQDRWNDECIISNGDFLLTVLGFRNMKISDALRSDNYIVKILAVLDRRTGKRTLLKIAGSGEYAEYPEWVRKFFILRLESEGIIK